MELEVGGWVQPSGLTRKSSQNSHMDTCTLTDICVYVVFICMLLKVVSNYGLTVLAMSVINGFPQKSLDRGVSG